MSATISIKMPYWQREILLEDMAWLIIVEDDTSDPMTYSMAYRIAEAILQRIKDE